LNSNEPIEQEKHAVHSNGFADLPNKNASFIGHVIINPWISWGTLQTSPLFETLDVSIGNSSSIMLT
jgi:hypothetical protein